MNGKTGIPGRAGKGAPVTMQTLKAFDAEPFAVLATEDRHGPYASLVAYALVPEQKSILVATPRNSRKYRNLVKRRHVALLIDRRSQGGEALMDADALTVLGEALPVKRGEGWKDLARAYEQKHPYLHSFLEARTTALVKIAIKEAVYVTRFQEVSTWLP
jgi:hypothetical protein